MPMFALKVFFLVDRIYLGDRCCCLHMPAADTESKRCTLANDGTGAGDTPCTQDRSGLSLAPGRRPYLAAGTPGVLLLSYHMVLLLPSPGWNRCSHGDRAVAG